MAAAFDSNVLVYAWLSPLDERSRPARELYRRLGFAGIYPVQMLGEVLNVCRRKAPRLWSDTSQEIATLLLGATTPLTTPDVLVSAAALATRSNLQLWDAVIITAAARSGADVLLSEDMQDRATYGGVTILNPFAADADARLDAALGPNWRQP